MRLTEVNMDLFRRPAALILTVFLLFSACGCTEGKLPVQEQSTVVRVIVKNKNADFWSVVKMGAEAAEKEFGIRVDFEGPTDEKDINGQIDLVRSAIEDKVDAIVLAACDYVKLVDVAEEAVSRKIPVIIIDSDLKSDKMKCFIGTDNVDAGRKLGECLIEKVGKKCSISVMSFVKGAASSDQREEGFNSFIKGYQGVKVLSVEYCNSDETTAERLTEKLTVRRPKLDAIVCLNAYGAIGTARVISRLGLSGKIKVIGFDSNPEEINFMEKDVIQSLVIQNPFSMGYLGVKYALDAISGTPVSKRIDTRSKVIDINNMYEPENEKLLFPFTN